MSDAANVDEFLIVAVKYSKNWQTLFWRPAGAGYTTDVDLAGVYTREKAEQTCAGSYGEHIPVERAKVVSRSYRTVSDSWAHTWARERITSPPQASGGGR